MILNYAFSGADWRCPFGGSGAAYRQGQTRLMRTVKWLIFIFCEVAVLLHIEQRVHAWIC
jgi:hypothetical protein